MRTKPLSNAKELEKIVAKIVTAYLEGISSDTEKGLVQLVPPLYAASTAISRVGSRSYRCTGCSLNDLSCNES